MQELEETLGFKFYFNAHIVGSESVISPLTRLFTKPPPYVSCRWWWAFEDIVLGFCVNPLLSSALAGCLLLLIQRNLPGSQGPLEYLSTNSEVLMESEKFTCREANCRWFIEVISEWRTRISNKIIRALDSECSLPPPVPDNSILCFDGQ